jgi:hypothetical protein
MGHGAEVRGKPDDELSIYAIWDIINGAFDCKLPTELPVTGIWRIRIFKVTRGTIVY